MVGAEQVVARGCAKEQKGKGADWARRTELVVCKELSCTITLEVAPVSQWQSRPAPWIGA